VSTSERSARTTARTRANASLSRPAVARSLNRSRRSSASAPDTSRAGVTWGASQQYRIAASNRDLAHPQQVLGVRARASDAAEHNRCRRRRLGSCILASGPAVAGSSPYSGPSASSLSDSLLITSGAERRCSRQPFRTDNRRQTFASNPDASNPDAIATPSGGRRSGRNKSMKSRAPDERCSHH
jgi:hypothetical protein